MRRSVFQQFDIGSPDKRDRMDGTEDLDDGPALVGDRRFRTPVRAPPVNRKNDVHNEEPGTKGIITGDKSDDELNEISERQTDEKVVSQGVLQGGDG